MRGTVLAFILAAGPAGMGTGFVPTLLGVPYPKLQMLWLDELLDGRRFNTPGVVGRGQDSQQTKIALEEPGA